MKAVNLTRKQIRLGLEGCNDTIDPITHEDLEPQNTIRLYFTIKSAKGPGLSPNQSVIECYNINSIFEYVFTQVYENKIRTDSGLLAIPIVTPLRKTLSVAQISRIKRDYFAQSSSSREYNTLTDFNRELDSRRANRIQSERDAQIQAYQDLEEEASGDYLEPNDSDIQRAIKTWLLDNIPDLRDFDSDFLTETLNHLEEDLILLNYSDGIPAILRTLDNNRVSIVDDITRALDVIYR